MTIEIAAGSGMSPFHHYVGIDRLDAVASRADRICVLNILGQESRAVTPTSHEFSGGNVVFGTSPGRSGHSLATKIGPIPVFNDVREGLAAGLRFNTGVVYLPPSAVRDGVAELTRVNPDLRKIVIVTEKISIQDSREIRAMAQARKIDVFGANGLGVADSWNQVRIGGALGGDDPASALQRGSIAIFSNSGNFTTTIATYLAAGGWGTTTLVSSGKDVYIQFAAPEFIHAFNNDPRSEAAVLYIEPGGYYEHDVQSHKPVIACVVGRWKARLTRAVGHAGALAGAGDDAFAKENWFLEKFGCSGPFTLEDPICSSRGALVLNIAHIPAALDAVMRLNGRGPDFPPQGNLSLKPWFANTQGLKLPRELNLPVVEAPAPFNQQIAEFHSRIGASFRRQALRNASGATQLDRSTQTARLHGVSILEAARSPFSANLALALLRERPDQWVASAIDAVLLSEAKLGPAISDAIAIARDAGSTPNVIMSIAAASLGPNQFRSARIATEICLELLLGRINQAEAAARLSAENSLWQDTESAEADRIGAALAACQGAHGVLATIADVPRHPSSRLMAAATSAIAGVGPLRRRRLSVETVLCLPWHFGSAAGMIVALRPAVAEYASRSFQDLIGSVLIGARQGDFGARLNALLGLLASNGPGAISALGPKAAVSADGPETPARVQINKAYIGFLTHCGYAHGGNGFEGIRFLLDCFEGTDVSNSFDCASVDLSALAIVRAAAFKGAKKASGQRQLIPGLNHPVFRGQAVNIDPREVFIWETACALGSPNVFHAFYRELASELYRQGVTPNVFCVNVDAVIASELLAAFWLALRSGSISQAHLAKAAFATFLVARIVGAAAEIEDHRNRGRDMDMRTPNEECRFVT